MCSDTFQSQGTHIFHTFIQQLYTEVIHNEGGFLPGSLPEEVAVLRKSSDRVLRLQQSISVPVKTSKMLSKTERDKIAVDMYNNGYSVNEIMAHCNVKSKSTVYQILGKYNVALSRKPGRVPGNRK